MYQRTERDIRIFETRERSFVIVAVTVVMVVELVTSSVGLRETEINTRENSG